MVLDELVDLFGQGIEVGLGQRSTVDLGEEFLGKGLREQRNGLFSLLALRRDVQGKHVVYRHFMLRRRGTWQEATSKGIRTEEKRIEKSSLLSTYFRRKDFLIGRRDLFLARRRTSDRSVSISVG